MNPLCGKDSKESNHLLQLAALRTIINNIESQFHFRMNLLASMLFINHFRQLYTGE